MPNVTKDVVKVINETDYATLAHGVSTTLDNCLVIDLSKATSLVFAIKATTVPGTITLTLYASKDNTDVDEDGSWKSYGTVPWNPNSVWATGWVHTTTVLQQNSPEVPTGAKYLRVIATNDHGADNVVALEVHAILQTLG